MSGPWSGSDVARLRRIAEAATPGGWDAVVLGSEGYDVRAPNMDSPIRRIRVARCGYEAWEVDRANAEHIAAFNPTTALELLDQVRVEPISSHIYGDREALVAELQPLIGAHADVVANHLVAAGFHR